MAESISDPSDPSFFCYSGELLWGQLHCITEGYLVNRTDDPFTLPSPLTGGSIKQRNYKYRVKAARGQWNVKEIKSRLVHAEPSFLSGFVVYNNDLVDPVEIIKSCARGGMSNNQDGDKTIVYVNRYDWSWGHEMPEQVEKLLCADLDDSMEHQIRRMLGKRLILVDPSAGMTVINQFKESIAGFSRNSLIKQILKVGIDKDPIGVHLACPDTEYELGWMVFASNQELIAFVYDGAYTALEGELSFNDGRVIRSAEHADE